LGQQAATEELSSAGDRAATDRDTIVASVPNPAAQPNATAASSDHPVSVVVDSDSFVAVEEVEQQPEASSDAANIQIAAPSVADVAEAAFIPDEIRIETTPADSQSSIDVAPAPAESVAQALPAISPFSSNGAAQPSASYNPSAPFAFSAPPAVLPSAGVPVANGGSYQPPVYNPSAPFAFRVPHSIATPPVSPVPFNPAAYPGTSAAIATPPGFDPAIVQAPYGASAAIPLQVPYAPAGGQQTTLPAPPAIVPPVAQLPAYPYSPGQPAPAPSYPYSAYPYPYPYPQSAPAPSYPYPAGIQPPPIQAAPASGYAYPAPAMSQMAPVPGYPYPVNPQAAPAPGYPYFTTQPAPVPGYPYPQFQPAPGYSYPQSIPSAPAPGYVNPTYPPGSTNPAAPAPIYPYPSASPVVPAPAPQPASPPTAQTPLLRSSALTSPRLDLQGVYLLQDSESSARARLSGVYPLTPNLLFGGSLDLTEGDAFSDSRTEGLSVNELYLAASLQDLPNLRFVLGQLDLTSYFDRNSFAKDGASQFFNSVFQTNPALTAASVGSRPGILVNWSLTDNIEARATAFSSSRNLDDFSLDGFGGEIGLRFGNAIIRGTYISARDAGNGDGFREIFGIDRGNGETGLQDDDREEGYGVNAEIFIPELNMGIFGRYGHYENRELEEGGDTYSGGISFLDVFSRDDRLGIAYGRALSNDRLRDDERTPDVLEVFYDFRLLPNLRLGFTFQQQNEFSDTVAGFRLRTDFDITPRGL
jgi:hypothetical protein